MVLIKRLDHMIVCVRDRREWVPVIEEVLALKPARSREGDEWGFSNAEFDIGDGFLGVVEPAGESSQLNAFLARYPEGFYAISIDVGDLRSAAAFFEARAVRVRQAMRDGKPSLLWVPPAVTGGVLYQVTAGSGVRQGTNPLYRGISQVVIAVQDLAAASADYARIFGFETHTLVTDERLGYRGAVLAAPGSTLNDSLVLAEPTDDARPLGRHLASRGPGIFQFTIDTTDLAREQARLESQSVSVEVSAPSASPQRLWIDPQALRGLRVELRHSAP